MDGNHGFKNGIHGRRDWKKEKLERKCDVCKGKGHTSDKCFKVIGYPDWYYTLKSDKGKGSKPRIGANVTIEELDTEDIPLEGNGDSSMNSGKKQHKSEPSGFAYANCAGPM